MEGPWSLKNMSGENWNRVMERMAEYKRMTRSRLLKTGSHPTPVGRFCEEARRRLRTVKGADWMKDELDLFSFRITKQERLWCFEKILNEKQATYKIFWWDPNHTVFPYKRGKK